VFAKGEAFYGHPLQQSLPLTLQRSIVEPDGRFTMLWIASTEPKVGSADVSYVLTRLRPDGSLDTDFGKGGLITSRELGHNELSPTSISQLPDLSYLISGNRFDSSGAYFSWRIKDGGFNLEVQQQINSSVTPHKKPHVAFGNLDAF
jgi:hypothetical protein